MRNTEVAVFATSYFFGLLPHRSQPSGEPFSFTCKEVSPMGLLFCKIHFNIIISIFLFYIVVIWNIYNFIKPFRQFSLCTALPYILQTRRNCPGVKQPFAPEQQGRAVEPSCGAYRHHTPLRMPHTFRAATEGEARPFTQKLTHVQLH